MEETTPESQGTLCLPSWGPLPSLPESLGCFPRVAVVAGETTAAAALASLIRALGNNFPPRARRPRKLLYNFRVVVSDALEPSSGWSERVPGWILAGGPGFCYVCARLGRLVSDFSMLPPGPDISSRSGSRVASWQDQEVSGRGLNREESSSNPMALDPLLLEKALGSWLTSFFTSNIRLQLGTRRRIPKWGRRQYIPRLVVPSLFSNIQGVSLLSHWQGLVTLDSRELLYHLCPEYCFHWPGSHLLQTF